MQYCTGCHYSTAQVRDAESLEVLCLEVLCQFLVCKLVGECPVIEFECKELCAEILNETKQNGGRVICVGTTSCRTLESLVNEDGSFEAKSKWTEIFIYPGYSFKAMQGLITNFHLPESTLVMLVSAFAGREHVLRAYEEAVRERYRFFSFGDAMCIL